MTHPLAYMVAAAVGVIAAVYLVFNSRNSQENQQHSHVRRSRPADNNNYNPSRSWEDDDEENKYEPPTKRQQKRRRSGNGPQNQRPTPGCAICMESFNDLVNAGRNLCTAIPCGHVYCEKCIKASLERSQSCPRCRGVVTELQPAFL